MRGKVNLSDVSKGTYNDCKNMATRVRLNITEHDRSSLRKKTSIVTARTEGAS